MQSLRAITLRGFLGAVISVIIWASTHGFFWVFDRWFELALFPKALLAFGALAGTALMAVASFLICWGLVALYDWYGTHDWSSVKNWIVRKFLTELQDALGFEALKEIGGTARAKLVPFAGFLFRHKLEKIALFLYTSIWNDPMTCLILMRPARMYGMGKREWKIFLGSVVLSNASWGTLMTAGMYFVQKYVPWLWHGWLTLIHWLTPHLFT